MVGMRTDTLMFLLGAAGSRLARPPRTEGFASLDAGGDEGVVGRCDGGRRPDLARHGVEGLQAVSRVDDDGLQRGVELAGLHELAQYCDRRTARRLGEDALGA